MQSGSKIAFGVAVVAALVALGAVFIWAPVCDHGVELANGNMAPMRCAYTGKVGALLSIGIAVVGAVSLAQKKPGAAGVVALLVLSCALFLISFDTPLSIGVCMADGMACHATAAWLRACAAVAFVATIAAALASPNRKRAA